MASTPPSDRTTFASSARLPSGRPSATRQAARWTGVAVRRPNARGCVRSVSSETSVTLRTATSPLSPHRDLTDLGPCLAVPASTPAPSPSGACCRHRPVRHRRPPCRAPRTAEHEAPRLSAPPRVAPATPVFRARARAGLPRRLAWASEPSTRVSTLGVWGARRPLGHGSLVSLRRRPSAGQPSPDRDSDRTRTHRRNASGMVDRCSRWHGRAGAGPKGRRGAFPAKVWVRRG